MPSHRIRVRASRAMALVAVLGGAILAPPSAGAAVLPSDCTRLAMSPTYDKDGTAFCAGYRRYFRTTNHGHSWQSASATGLPDASPNQVVFSPRYSVDKTIVVVAAGVYVTTNAGETFTPLSTLDLGPRLTPFIWGGPLGSALPLEHAAFAAALGPQDLSSVLDPTLALREPVVGSADRDRAFVISPDYTKDQTAFLLTNGGTGAPETLYPSLYSCDAAFTCGVKVHDFPKNSQADRAWFAPDFSKSKTMFVSTIGFDYRFRLYQTHDGGSTFTPWTSVQRILDAYKSGGTIFDLASGPAGSRTMWMRVQVPTDHANPPLERIFRSTNDGATWQQVAYGRGCCQPGPRGNIPADQGLSAPDNTAPGGFLLVSPAGRMLMLGRSNGANTVLCSPDAGRTWRRLC